jgi:hypothetical protein
VKDMLSPEEMMLISAVRYALGRKSYIVGETCKFVLDIKDKLSENCIAIIIRDIEEELELCHRLGHTLGMDFDERAWINLLNNFKEGNAK